MPSLRLFTGNRLETLAHELAEVIRTPLSSPFEKDVIVVQSRGMERWISMELAGLHGICANIHFPFPNTFVFEILGKAFPDLPAQSVFDPEIMTWRIMGLLPSLIAGPGFESLRTYLEKTPGGLKRFQLSQRIADLFDQYLIFRPEMMLGWEQGREDHWQAVLWRQLVKGNENAHRGVLGKSLIDLFENPSNQFKDLPERISVFGISTLPRFHMQVFASISRFTRVNLFLMNPCMEYWGDIASDWEMKKVAGRGPLKSFSREDLHLEKGNSLLVSMGKLGRDFFDLINEFDCEEIQTFAQPGENNLLNTIQTDILNLRERPRDSNGKKTLSENDVSIQVHSCHSPMREVEVLHDRLLEMFENNTDLRPKDILVMTPDIEAYAPYIQAVFDVPPSDPTRIPFSIADRSVKVEGKIIETFLEIMRLWDGRFSAFEVMNILESRAVQHRFGLSETDLALIRDWVELTRIRWGIDGASRSEMGLPDLSENTWKAGLDRLLLGYAMPGQEDNMFAGVLPFDNMEGSDTSVLGRFLEFTDQLFHHVKTLGQPNTLDEWCRVLKEFLEAFFLPDEDTEAEAQIIRRTLNNLAEEGERSGFDEKVHVDVMRCCLEQRLEKEGFGFGFITGSVTFCAMLPMRSIPFKVICLMGMNNDSYPRQSKPLGFDLMVREPRKGDRSRRNDDRYLFLEAMLSAREILYISYVGHSIRDNTVIPPSVLVSEMLDYTEQGFRLQDRKIPEFITTKHRLQPFSTEYFKKEGRLFCYSREHLKAAEYLLKPRKTPTPFISGKISNPGEEWHTVDVEDLCRFFVNPTRFLLNRRLGIYLDEGIAMLQETEPFDVTGLENYLLAQDLVERRLAGHGLKDFFHLTRAAGLLPHGTVGECIYEGMCREIEGFVEKIGAYIRKGMLAPLEVDLGISGFRLIGRTGAIYPERMVRYRYAKIKPKDRLRTWIHHLVLNCAKSPGYPLYTMVVGLDKEWAAWEYAPVEDAKGMLETLLHKYWEGLTRPIHFFPESAWQYAQQMLEKKKSGEEALKKAYERWMGGYHPGERDDAHYTLSFRNTNPIDPEFQETALEVFGPIIASQRKVQT
ncbi:MAG: exodeoxyribonuclease V subunit gamma [Deltaproteobacteria bacterium]|nr:exodeoxyribonuclease V subunit gamma [Deltaproteobacteria bacterium]